MHFEIKLQLQLVIMQSIMQFSLTMYSDLKIQFPATSQSFSSDIIFISIVLLMTKDPVWAGQMTNKNLNWADSGSTDGEVCHKFGVNKVEQNFEQYVRPHVISRNRPISRILG